MINKIVGAVMSNKLKLVKCYIPLVFTDNTKYLSKEYVSGKSYSNEFLDAEECENVTYYSIYKSIFKRSDEDKFVNNFVVPNFFIMSPRKVGRELIKTALTVVKDKDEYYNSIFEVIDGKGVFILESLFTEHKQVKIIKVKKGDRVLVPAEFAFVMVNTKSDEEFAVLGYTSTGAKFETGLMQENCGGTIYFTNKGFIRNKNAHFYYVLEDFEGDYLKTLEFDRDMELYEHFITNPEKFRFLNN